MNAPVTDERRGCTSASNAEADSLCPGRHLAQQGLPERARNDADAETGERIHRALAGYRADGGMDALKLSISEMETYDACRDQERALANQFFGEGAGDRTNPLEVIRETRLWGRIRLAKSSDQPPAIVLEHSAKPDVIYRKGTRALVIEYKTLFGVVPESPRNLQLRDQVCLVAANLLCDEVGAAVVQPHVSHDLPQICLYDAAAIKLAREQMKGRVIASNDPKSMRVAGEVQCKFCRAREVGCPEHQRLAAGLLRALPGQEGLAYEGLVATPVSQWSPEQRAFFLERESIGRDWLEETKAQIKSLMKLTPDAVPGWTLRKGAVRQPVTDPQKCFERFAALAKDAGLDGAGALDRFMATVKIAKDMLASQVSHMTGKRGKPLGAVMAQLTAGITESVQSEPIIVRRKEGDNA